MNPIMEVGPTRNVAFWNLPREPKYDTHLIAMWRMYARLHQRLIDYSYAHALEATKTGMPIVRPLFLVDPDAPAAWSNWWTYLYGRDILVSPVWEKGKREQQVYLPSGQRWRDAWNGKIYRGGQPIKVPAPTHQLRPTTGAAPVPRRPTVPNDRFVMAMTNRGGPSRVCGGGGKATRPGRRWRPCGDSRWLPWLKFARTADRTAYRATAEVIAITNGRARIVRGCEGRRQYRRSAHRAIFNNTE